MLSQIQVLSIPLVLILLLRLFTNYVSFFTSYKMGFSTFTVLITLPLMICLTMYFKNIYNLQVIEKITWMQFKIKKRTLFFYE